MELVMDAGAEQSILVKNAVTPPDPCDCCGQQKNVKLKDPDNLSLL